MSIHLLASHSTQRVQTEEYGHKKTKKNKPRGVAFFVSRRASSVLLSQREEGGNEAIQGVCTCTVSLITSGTAVRQSGRWRAALICVVRVGLLARRPVVAHAQLGPGDGHLVHAGGAHLWREVDDAAVVLHVLKLVLLGGLHVDHRVLVYVLL